jgi:hypothetical protein
MPELRFQWRIINVAFNWRRGEARFKRLNRQAMCAFRRQHEQHGAEVFILHKNIFTAMGLFNVEFVLRLMFLARQVIMVFSRFKCRRADHFRN